MKKTYSIIIPSYNSEEYIENSLAVLEKIDYDKNLLEVIIIDDGSTDNSAKIIKEFCSKNNYAKYFYKKNGQWGSVINYAKNKKLVNNDYVAILDSDDFYDSNIFNILNDLAKFDDDMLVGSFKKFDGKKIRKRVIPYWFIFRRKLTDKKMMNTPYCLPLTFFSKKEIFYKLKDIDEGIAYQDPDYLSQLVLNSNSLRFTRKVIGYYYYNRNNNSVSQPWTQKRYEAELNACKKCISNDAIENVSYRLNIKKFFCKIKENNHVFEINRKLSFKWFPFYLRWIYFIIHEIKFNKVFRNK